MYFLLAIACEFLHDQTGNVKQGKSQISTTLFNSKIKLLSSVCQSFAEEVRALKEF